MLDHTPKYKPILRELLEMESWQLLFREHSEFKISN